MSNLIQASPSAPLVRFTKARTRTIHTVHVIQSFACFYSHSSCDAELCMFVEGAVDTSRVEITLVCILLLGSMYAWVLLYSATVYCSSIEALCVLFHCWFCRLGQWILSLPGPLEWLTLCLTLPSSQTLLKWYAVILVEDVKFTTVCLWLFQYWTVCMYLLTTIWCELN